MFITCISSGNFIIIFMTSFSGVRHIILSRLQHSMSSYLVCCFSHETLSQSLNILFFLLRYQPPGDVGLRKEGLLLPHRFSSSSLIWPFINTCQRPQSHFVHLSIHWHSVLVVLSPFQVDLGFLGAACCSPLGYLLF